MQKDEIDEFVNRLYHNDYKHKKNAYKENEDKNNKNEGEAADFIIRLEEDQKKRNENLENLKNELENNERQVCTYKPEMCKGSKKYNEAISNDFFERQKKYTEKINEKDEKLKEILKKREEDEIKENNNLKRTNNPNTNTNISINTDRYINNRNSNTDNNRYANKNERSIFKNDCRL